MILVARCMACMPVHAVNAAPTAALHRVTADIGEDHATRNCTCGDWPDRCFRCLVHPQGGRRSLHRHWNTSSGGRRSSHRCPSPRSSRLLLWAARGRRISTSWLLPPIWLGIRGWMAIWVSRVRSPGLGVRWQVSLSSLTRRFGSAAMCRRPPKIRAVLYRVLV